MTKLAERIIRWRRCSIIFEFWISRAPWVIFPTLIYFAPGVPDKLGGNPNAHDLTLAWIRFGVTLRYEPAGKN